MNDNKVDQLEQFYGHSPEMQELIGGLALRQLGDINDLIEPITHTTKNNSDEISNQ